MTTASCARGFTLIELLVVLLLVALGSSLVALSLRDTPQHLLEREADRLIVVLENARAQARSRSTPLLLLMSVGTTPRLTPRRAARRARAVAAVRLSLASPMTTNHLRLD